MRWVGLVQSVGGHKREKGHIPPPSPPKKGEFCQQIAFQLGLQHQRPACKLTLQILNLPASIITRQFLKINPI